MFAKIHYLWVPCFYLLVALAGKFFAAQGAEWYPTLVKPEYTPSGTFIGLVWPAIFILTAYSLITFINEARPSPLFGIVIRLYLVNGIMNAAWSFIFFTAQQLSFAVLAAVAIAGSVCLIMILARAHSYKAAILLLPYFAWSSLGALLSYDIFRLNP